MHDHFFRYGHFLWFVGAIVCSILRLFLGARCHCFEYWVEREHPQPESTTTTVDARMESMTAVDKSIEQKALSTMSANGESAKPFTIPEFIKLRLYPQFFSVMCVDTRTKSRAWSGSGKCTTIHMEEPFWRMIWVWERRCKWLSICGVCMLAVKSTPA